MKYYTCLLALLFSTGAVAQVPTSDEPGREAARFEQSNAPQAKLGGLITLPGVVAPEGAGSITLRVADVQVTGGSVYQNGEIEQLLAEIIGQEVLLSQVYELAQQLTAKYGGDGYVLSRAIIPPQELDPAGAVVSIKIVEGYIDSVEWPASTERYRDFFAEYSAKMIAERPANINTVMRYLLLAGDLPGIDVTSRFQASDSNPNASTLKVEMTEKPLDVLAQIDNRGTEPRGPWQFSTSATHNNVLGIHEAVRFSYSGAVEAKELQRIALAYRQILTSEGLFGFANTSWSWGEPGTATLEALEFKSTSTSFDVGFGIPIVRERERNLTLSALAFLSNSTGEMFGAPSSDDRLRGIRVVADFDLADSFNGVTQGNITLSHGFEGLGSSVNGSLLASRENGRVDFTTVFGSLSRVQEFDGGFSALVAASGQYAFTPLLSQEECGYGGRDFGRAFNPSEISGDTCWSVSGEVRFDPDLPNNPLSLTQFYAFADYGQVFRIAPSLGTPGIAGGASAGLGVRLGTDNFTADLSAVKPLHGRINDNWRFFLTAVARY